MFAQRIPSSPLLDAKNDYRIDDFSPGMYFSENLETNGLEIFR
jgi:hypothetical protein